MTKGNLLLSFTKHFRAIKYGENGKWSRATAKLDVLIDSFHKIHFLCDKLGELKSKSKVQFNFIILFLPHAKVRLLHMAQYLAVIWRFSVLCARSQVSNYCSEYAYTLEWRPTCFLCEHYRNNDRDHKMCQPYFCPAEYTTKSKPKPNKKTNRTLKRKLKKKVNEIKI